VNKSEKAEDFGRKSYAILVTMGVVGAAILVWSAFSFVVTVVLSMAVCVCLDVLYRTDNRTERLADRVLDELFYQLLRHLGKYEAERIGSWYTKRMARARTLRCRRGCRLEEESLDNGES
jgi:hypothetical protein